MFLELLFTLSCMTRTHMQAWERPIMVRDGNVSLNYAQLAISDAHYMHCMPTTLCSTPHMQIVTSVSK